jgi:hypothetical protein
MSQYLIKANLAKFVELTQTDDAKVLAEALRQLPALCHGLSLCHGAMDCIGKLAWWEAALKAVAAWDGSTGYLDAPVNLPDSEIAYTHRQIFTRVLNYVLTSQVVDEIGKLSDFIIKDISQLNILDPKQSFFEIITPAKQVFSIKKHAVIAGFFAANELENLFDENKLRQGFLLIANHVHLIRIGYHNGNWIVYDPEYEHNTSEMLHKVLADKQLFIQEIIQSQGHSLALHAVSFIDNADIEYTYAVKLSINSLLAGYGLHRMAEHSHAQLAATINAAYQEPTICAALAEALVAKDLDNRTGLQAIIYSVPEGLTEIIKLATQKTIIYDALCQALVMQGYENCTGLHAIARKSPEQLSILIRSAYKEHAICNALAAALYIQDDYEYTALHMIIRYAPVQFGEIIALARQEPNICSALLKALQFSDSDGFTILHTIASYASEQLVLFMELIKEKESPFLYEIFAQMLITQSILDNWTALHSIAYFAPKQLTEIFILARKQQTIMAVLAQAIRTLANNNVTILDIIIERAPEQFQALFELAEEVSDIRHALTEIIFFKDKQNQTGFQKLAYFASEYIDKLFTFAIDTKHAEQFLIELIILVKQDALLQTVLASALTKKSYGNTPLSLLKFCKLEQYLMSLLNSIAQNPQCLADILIILAQPDIDSQTGWHLLNEVCTKADCDALLALLFSKVAEIDLFYASYLIEQLNVALNDIDSPYRGLCLQDDKSNIYGETYLWQQLIDHLQAHVANLQANQPFNSSMPPTYSNCYANFF